MDNRRIVAWTIAATWLVVVCLLPRKPSNVVAGIGLMIGFVCLFRRDDPKEQPRWGCYVSIPVVTIEIKRKPRSSSLADASLNRRTLLRPTQEESDPAQELLRSASTESVCSAEESLRGSDRPE